MALINCPECGKEVSDKAISCPNCGIPISVQQSESEEYLACPKCASKELHAEQKGFSGGKALAGAVLTGGIGLLAGTIGSRDVNITCLKCGNRFKTGEAVTVKKGRAANDLDRRVCALLHEGEYIQAVKLHQDETNESLANTVTYIKGIAEKENINLKKNDNSGCASVIVVFVIVASAIAFMV